MGGCAILVAGTSPTEIAKDFEFFFFFFKCADNLDICDRLWEKGALHSIIEK